MASKRQTEQSTRDPEDAGTPEGARPAGEASAPKDAPGYEQAREELQEVVRRLEAGGTSLEESLALWERGEQLARVCQRWLDGARARLDAALAEEEQPQPGA